MSAKNGGPEYTGTRVQPADEPESDPFNPDDSGPYPVHGLAIPEDGLTFGKDEQWRFWPEATARSAEGLLTGRNIVDLHPESPTNDDVIGEVTGETYIDGLGLAWTGEVDSRKRAKQAYRGRLDSSPYLFGEDGDSSALPDDAPEGTKVAGTVSKIRDIGFVPDGAVQGSEVQAGPHPEATESGDVQTALSAGFGETDKPGASESGGMSDEEQDTIEELKQRISDLEDENESLESQIQTLRRPYLEAVTADSDLSPEQVNMTAEDLAEYFSGDEDGENAGGEGGEDENPSAGGSGATGGPDTSGEATALSAAPLTAARGSPPGSGSAAALSEGEAGGSGGEGGSSDVSVPDEPLEVLEERRRLAKGRTSSEHVEQLDKQIEAKKQAGGS